MWERNNQQTDTSQLQQVWWTLASVWARITQPLNRLVSLLVMRFFGMLGALAIELLAIAFMPHYLPHPPATKGRRLGLLFIRHFLSVLIWVVALFALGLYGPFVDAIGLKWLKTLAQGLTLSLSNHYSIPLVLGLVGGGCAFLAQVVVYAAVYVLPSPREKMTDMAQSFRDSRFLKSLERGTTFLEGLFFVPHLLFASANRPLRPWYVRWPLHIISLALVGGLFFLAGMLPGINGFILSYMSPFGGEFAGYTASIVFAITGAACMAMIQLHDMVMRLMAMPDQAQETDGGSESDQSIGDMLRLGKPTRSSDISSNQSISTQWIFFLHAIILNPLGYGRWGNFSKEEKTALATIHLLFWGGIAALVVGTLLGSFFAAGVFGVLGASLAGGRLYWQWKNEQDRYDNYDGWLKTASAVLIAEDANNENCKPWVTRLLYFMRPIEKQEAQENTQESGGEDIIDPHLLARQSQKKKPWWEKEYLTPFLLFWIQLLFFPHRSNIFHPQKRNKLNKHRTADVLKYGMFTMLSWAIIFGLLGHFTALPELLERLIPLSLWANPFFLAGMAACAAGLAQVFVRRFLHHPQVIQKLLFAPHLMPYRGDEKIESYRGSALGWRILHMTLWGGFVAMLGTALSVLTGGWDGGALGRMGVPVVGFGVGVACAAFVQFVDLWLRQRAVYPNLSHDAWRHSENAPGQWLFFFHSLLWNPMAYGQWKFPGYPKGATRITNLLRVGQTLIWGGITAIVGIALLGVEAGVFGMLGAGLAWAHQEYQKQNDEQPPADTQPASDTESILLPESGGNNRTKIVGPLYTQWSTYAQRAIDREDTLGGGPGIFACMRPTALKDARDDEYVTKTSPPSIPFN